MTVQKFRPEWDSITGTAWMKNAACKSNPSAEHAFIYGGAKVRNQAIETFCGNCPVREQCLNFGMESMSEGVWGGVHRTMADAQTLNNRQSAVRTHERGRMRSIVAKMYRAGLSIRKISYELKRSDETIKALIVEAGIPLRGCKDGS